MKCACPVGSCSRKDARTFVCLLEMELLARINLIGIAHDERRPPTSRNDDVSTLVLLGGLRTGGEQPSRQRLPRRQRRNALLRARSCQASKWRCERHLRNRFESNCAPLTVHTSGNSDFFLVLKTATKEEKAATIYVSGGDTYEGGMPHGSYVLYYTSGDRWYGESNYFGPSAPVSKADSDLDFQGSATGSSGVELTLYAVPGGNLSTSEADYSDLN